MKRGKDDDKIRGPMFPRLHVNDTEKGGPRAPPRNKMALYEQLSIPSQRFNPGVVPRVSNNASNLVPPGSSSQGSGLERNVLYPYYVPPSAPTHLAEKLHSRLPDRGTSNTSLVQPVQCKKVGDEDDFTVPVFVHSGKSQNHIKMQTSADREKLVTLSPTYPGRSLKPQNDGVNDPKHIGSTALNLRKDGRNKSKESSEACVSHSNHISRSSINWPAREDISRPEGANSSQDQQYGDNAMSNSTRLCENDVCSQQGLAARLQSNLCAYDDSIPELTEEIEKSTNPLPGSDSCSRKDCSSPNEPEIDSECCGDKTYRSLQFRNGDKSNDASEASMVDSISALEISPDDVVGIIGQKHFWKARRAIVTQQRVFAVQVFELHRLIKVQQLIAGSPHLLLEDAARLGKHSAKSSPSDKLPSVCVVAPPVHVAERKGNTENPNHKIECSAENTVGKTSFSSVKNSLPANYGPYTGNPTATPMATDAKMGPCCFYPSLGQQWLIPVMSPSEGLIYKPYSAPGFMGSGCGGYGTSGPIPSAGNFINSAYGVPASHHQGIGVLPVTPPVGHGYFPPYGMPAMNPAMSGSVVDQMNYFAGSGSQGQTAQYREGRLNSDMQHQSSCIEPTQKSEAVSHGAKLQASKDSERQGSTGSSPSGRGQVVGNAQTAEERDAFSLFSTAPPASEGSHQPQETRVIKVVPRNARSATESAARIFQSIQEERKQYDST